MLWVQGVSWKTHGRISWKGSYEIALFFARSLEETTPVSTNQIATHPHGLSLCTQQDVIAVASSTVARLQVCFYHFFVPVLLACRNIRHHYSCQPLDESIARCDSSAPNLRRLDIQIQSLRDSKFCSIRKTDHNSRSGVLWSSAMALFACMLHISNRTTRDDKRSTLQNYCRHDFRGKVRHALRHHQYCNEQMLPLYPQ